MRGKICSRRDETCRGPGRLRSWTWWPRPAIPLPGAILVGVGDTLAALEELVLGYLSTLADVVSRVSHTTIDCRDAFLLSMWWKPVLGYTDVAGDPNEPGDEECMIVDPATGHRLLFIETGDTKLGKNPVHLDLAPTDRRRDEEVDRVVALGAAMVADRRQPDGSGWVVLADPEGNEFCVLRSDAERVHHSRPEL